MSLEADNPMFDTGADVKRQVMEALVRVPHTGSGPPGMRYVSSSQPAVEDVWQPALTALAPCIVLTAEEAAANTEALREGLTYAEACDTWPRGPHEEADHEGHKQDMRNALALLTPDQED